MLFDLLKEYETHKNITQLEKQLKELGQYYPKTKYYAEAQLNLKAPKQNYYYTNDNISNNNDYWGLGTKYKTKLNLKDEEVSLLNKLWYTSNNFYDLEYCRIEIIKIYLATIEELKNKYIQEGTTLDIQFQSVADAIAKNHYKYVGDSYNYKNSIELTIKEININIFKHCENFVREHYGHKRKINIEIYYTPNETKVEFETKIISKIRDILPTLISKIASPDEKTEIKLYSQNTNRWKLKFEELTANYKGNPKQFIESIVLLGTLNKKNPSIENIYFEASKFYF